MTEKEQDTRAERLGRAVAGNRAMVDQAIGAFNAGREALTILAMVLDDPKQSCVPRLEVAVRTVGRVRDVAAALLDAIAKSGDQASKPPARYRVTCPDCGHVNITEWTDALPPGGVAPVRCANCEYSILSESEGNPELIDETARAADRSEPAAAADPMAAAADMLLREARQSIDDAARALRGPGSVQTLDEQLAKRVQAAKGHLEGALRSTDTVLGLVRGGEATQKRRTG